MKFEVHGIKMVVTQKPAGSRRIYITKRVDEKEEQRKEEAMDLIVLPLEKRKEGKRKETKTVLANIGHVKTKSTLSRPPS